MEDKSFVRLTDEQAKRIIEMSSGCSNASEFQQLSECDKEEYLNEFKNKGVAIFKVSIWSASLGENVVVSYHSWDGKGDLYDLL